eukprot:TRINITY_DN3156_c0_g1_i1.p1 TRINITY_DN3156_c0_g1~~TRINITY_DN3156_c0_g1_i1.p1  ORF type:complete len:300 (+),score=106.37 TRINITY_DN3156_c0_g1_i1:105-1004(+)
MSTPETRPPTLKEETTKAANNALHKAAEKTGEVKQRIDQATEDAQIKLGEVANQAAQKTNELKVRLDDKAEDVKDQVSAERRELRDSFEKGKAQVRAETGTPESTQSDLSNEALLERAQKASDEVFLAAGEAPVPTDAEGSLLKTAANVVSDTVDLAKQAAAKTAETASSMAAHVSQAFEGVPRRVDLSEIEHKEAQDKVNELTAEHQELLDQADKKNAELHEEVHVNRAQGKPVSVPQTVSLAEVSSQTAVGIISAVGQKVSNAVEAVKDAVRGTPQEQDVKTTDDVDRLGADQTRAT